MNEPITIVDRGRGLQLSASRITLQDLVPYFQKHYADDEIIRWIPSLTSAEIAVVRRYYAEHQHELDEQDCRVRQRIAESVRQQEMCPRLAAARRRGARKPAVLREKFAQRNLSRGI
jgi:hypothetical protein